jgi:hypothetical protein
MTEQPQRHYASVAKVRRPPSTIQATTPKQMRHMPKSQ